MKYDRLLAELDALKQLAINDDVHHIGRQPMTAAMLQRRGLSASAAHPSLAAKIGAGSARKMADRMADEPFRWGKACYPGRYSMGFPALYTARDFDTAVAEVEYHLVRKGAVANGLRPHYIILTGQVSGTGKDLNLLPAACKLELVHDTDYRPTQAVGAAARSEALAALQVPSARKSRGVNLPVFDRAAVQPAEAKRKIVFFLDKRGEFSWTISSRNKSPKS